MGRQELGRRLQPADRPGGDRRLPRRRPRPAAHHRPRLQRRADAALRPARQHDPERHQVAEQQGGAPANFNEIRFEDKKGSELVFLHAEKDQDIEVEHDETHWVGHDRTKTIDHDETTHVKHDRTETVDNNETITIHGNRTETVDKDETITIHGNRTETVDKDETITIHGNRTETVDKDETITIHGGRTETVDKDESITIGGGRTENVSKDESITIGGGRTENVTKDESITIGGGRTESVTKDECDHHRRRPDRERIKDEGSRSGAHRSVARRSRSPPPTRSRSRPARPRSR